MNEGFKVEKKTRELSDTPISPTSLTSFSKVKRITVLCGNHECHPTQTPLNLLLSGSSAQAIPRLWTNINFRIYCLKLATAQPEFF